MCDSDEKETLLVVVVVVLSLGKRIVLIVGGVDMLYIPCWSWCDRGRFGGKIRRRFLCR
jgi:hypothetical protein